MGRGLISPQDQAPPRGRSSSAPSAGPAFNALTPGDPLPRFFQRDGRQRRFAWDSMAGRYLLYCTVMTTADPLGRSAVEAIAREGARFDDVFAGVFAVMTEPGDALGPHRLPDPEAIVCRTLGALPQGGLPEGRPDQPRRAWILIDPSLHVLAVVPFNAEDPEHRAVFQLMDGLPPPDRFGGIAVPPPVLVLPNVLGPDLRSRLIDLHQASGAAESDVILDNVRVVDAAFKRRTDCAITDQALVGGVAERLFRCITPEVRKLFFMQLNHFDRPIVACYGADNGGHYQPHRDNGLGPTAHRRFAVSVNLNEDFEGGELFFPEYGGAKVKAPAGWAVVFPCAILHGVAPVTGGRRYAFLPFMFDDEGARMKAANAAAPAAP